VPAFGPTEGVGELEGIVDLVVADVGAHELKAEIAETGELWHAFIEIRGEAEFLEAIDGKGVVLILDIDPKLRVRPSVADEALVL